jgi:hypothetical protein
VGEESGPTYRVGELLQRQALRQTGADNLLGDLVSGHATIFGRSRAVRLPR